ncbi:TPA: hypothetical protein CPT87_02790 [Candidatus Gastranaerophilales bacterium HUM_5]|jgi:hypothetical protein|nr:MAG TPA: hypothetical protein CPT99_00205 [Candidatus Gastranaerophilales bacterium HUM_4]DAA92168.1 MAG TPA: hypothetical protein CPT87_02790 [Candidatus Gastranaerophilales bacterium HUM_5]DAB13923.1 MAG TPA: hypothetical protein CPT97_09175 [Candidatus Gastranaerophilales bacterium HUM_17]DAB17835.1 MAG TPA: hypothetical protein CPT98_05350 [Candidatus Gastranaerophilales bacterium HUM_19]DAZ24988.1 MAG TPA: hypothetical protein [Caudoviricetes sp.]
MDTELENTTVTDNADNSASDGLGLDEQIEKALDEPASEPTEAEQEEVVTEPGKNEQDNIIECPEKFKNEDGSINIKNLIKSYTGLEPLINQKSSWEKERAELLKYKERLEALDKQKEDNAKQAGFNSALDMQQTYEVAQYEANEYLKYLQYLDDEARENVQNLLYRYANNPSEKLMREIEVEFAPDVNKRIAVQADRMRTKFEQDRQTMAETTRLTNIEDVISKSVDAHNELFNYEPFKNMFVNTLHRFGDNFTFEDAQVLMNTIVELKSAFEEEFKKNSASNEANKLATDKLASISGLNSAPASRQQMDRVDLNKLSNVQLDKLLDKYI